MTPYLSFYNLMAYDYAGSFSRLTAHQANLRPHSSSDITPFSSSAAITYYTSHSVPSSKIILGMPLYGRSFLNTSGLGQPFSGVGAGSWEQGVWDAKVLPREGAKECLDEEVGASWSWDEGRKELVSYDSVEMVGMKGEFVRQKELGGGMWWESSGDVKGEGSLIGKVSLVFSLESWVEEANSWFAVCESSGWEGWRSDGQDGEFVGVSGVEV